MASTMTLAPKPFNFSQDPMWIEFSTSLISGLGDPDEPNLSLYAQIWMRRNSIESFLTEVNLTYSRITTLTSMDLANITDVEPEPPTDASINSYAWGQLLKPACELKVSFEDMFGSPVEFPSSLQNTPYYWIVYGGTTYYYGIGTGAPTNFLLHGYVDKFGNLVIKQTRKSQPEYIYFFSAAGGSFSLGVELIYTDGSSTLHTLNSVTGQTGVNFVTCGWDQSGIGAHLDPDLTLGMYRIYITGISGNNSVFYQLDDHDTEYDEYILYDNGIGGCETLRCSGRHQEDFEGTKTLISKPRRRGYTSREGLSGHVNASGADVMKLNTGYIPAAYARHLRQLPLANVWYINRPRNKFEKVTIKESSINLVDLGSDLQSIDFTIIFDNRESANNFGI